MLSKIKTGALVVLLAAPLASQATEVVWAVTGTLDTVTGSSVPGTLAAGMDFSFILHFDTAIGAPSPDPQQRCTQNGNVAAGASGTLCRYLGQATTAEYISDVVVGGTSFNDLVSTTAAGNGIFIRNDFGSPATDGYTFGITRDDGGGEQTSFLLALRGSNDLTVVTDGTVIPDVPPPSLASLNGDLFQVCDTSATAQSSCDVLEVDAHINSVSAVPEPATLGLMGFGAAALGLLRRRRSIR